eukprot:scaffold2450_cov401-Prasinococcus_capsulatus_cf.AAC.11
MTRWSISETCRAGIASPSTTVSAPRALIRWPPLGSQQCANRSVTQMARPRRAARKRASTLGGLSMRTIRRVSAIALLPNLSVNDHVPCTGSRK